MSDKTKDTRRRDAEKNRSRDEEVTREFTKAQINKKGHGDMRTVNKDAGAGKRGI